ncbi:PepSY-associated TM helix domain-containing protein [Sphingobacterium paramultivorum]|uniref:PepSY-associated TM helix domain-containing protein n=1 Tax=Sphingobacterium paramultivorum TaxID=2886510 RepID=UPI00129C242E|nr:PepSY-associated TM helix domain-containing protein [Sphingobacterium paramultivorum]
MFSKINAWLHLWLGLATGIPVIILAITGCVLVFEHDIKELTTNYIHVEPRSAEEQLPPSVIYKAVNHILPDKEIASSWYNGLDKSVKVSLDHSDSLVYVNPYTAEVLAIVDHEDFFHFMDEGHRHLWMPVKIGRQVVGWSTFIFFILLITGLVLWWPKKWNKRSREQSFSIKWKAKFKRVNYDLHNVLGFYSLTIALVMCFTGLIMSFPWIRSAVVSLTGGYPNKPKIEKSNKEEYIDQPLNDALVVADQIWHKVRREYAKYNKEAVIVHYPEPEDKTVYACTDMEGGTWRDLNFDRYTLELAGRKQGPIDEANTTEWLMRSNYALHTGFIGGMTTKIIYFVASLICATLPATGFYIWWGKKRKTVKKTKHTQLATP